MNAWADYIFSMYRLLFLLCYCYTLSISAQTDTLRIAVYDSPPFGMKGNQGRVGGLMVELWEDVAEELEVNYSYTLTDMEGLMQGLQDSVYDIGLGAISITPEREKFVDFSHAVNPSGTGIATARKSVSDTFFSKWAPILVDLLELILTLFIMLLISAFIVYFIEKKYGKGIKSERSISSLSDGLWWSAVTMTTVGYGDKVPRSKVGKFLSIIWIFISILFFSLFTANTSAKLSNYEVSSQVNTVDDLRNIRVVAVAQSSGEEFLIREGVRYEAVGSIQKAIDVVISGEADAVVSNIPVLKYHNKADYNNDLLISENFLLRNNMGIALKEGSPWKEKVDFILLEKISEPKWQDAVYKYIGD